MHVPLRVNQHAWISPSPAALMRASVIYKQRHVFSLNLNKDTHSQSKQHGQNIFLILTQNDNNDIRVLELVVRDTF